MFPAAQGRNLAQTFENSAVKDWILLHGGSILHVHGGSICSLGYFPNQPVVQNCSIRGCGIYCPVGGRVHIKDPLRLIGKSSLCVNSGFPLKKYVTMTIRFISNSQYYENQCVLEAALKKTNFSFFFWDSPNSSSKGLLFPVFPFSALLFTVPLLHFSLCLTRLASALPDERSTWSEAEQVNKHWPMPRGK